MKELDLVFILESYFQSFVFMFVLLLLFVICYPRKVSLRKAIFLMFLYAQFQPICDTITIYLIAGRNVEYNIYWYILLKFIIIIEMTLPIPFIIQTIRVKWYKIYWVYPASMMLMAPSILIYQNYFIKTDLVDAYTYQPITDANAWIYLLGIVVQVITALIVSIIIKKVATVKRLEQVPKIAWIIVNLPILYLICIGEKNYFVENNMLKGVSNYKLILALFFIAFVAVLYMLILSEQRILTIENNLLIKQNELQYESFQNKQEYELELHKLYHDIGNHIKTIQLLVEAGDKDKATNYAEDLLHSYQSIAKKQYSCNKIVNAVLSQKMKLCDELQIHTELELNLPEELPIRDIDLMCVLSNLLDNAIESCVRQQTGLPYIKLKASLQNQYCCFYLVNSKTLRKNENSAEGRKTWKKDKKMHGYGIKIIKEIVDRYEGQHEITETDEEFQALVMITI